MHRHTTLAGCALLIASAGTFAQPSAFGQQPQAPGTVQPPNAAIRQPAAIAPAPGSAYQTQAPLPAWQAPGALDKGSKPSSKPALAAHGASAPRTAAGRPRTRPNFVASAKVTQYVPDRGQRLQREVAAREAENAVALAARGHVPAVPPAAARAPVPGAGIAVRADAVNRVAPTAAMPTAARPLVREPLGIWYVNNKEINYKVTPGGYVTIHGRGFGDAVGQVNLFTTVDARQLALQVINWHRDEIFALLPSGARGLRDQPARLQVIARDGTPYVNDRGQFFAAREEMRLTTSLDRVMQVGSVSRWKPTLHADGTVERYDEGASIDCQAPGTDRLTFIPPTGYEVSGIDAQWGPQDSGDGNVYGMPGNRVFTPGYSFGEWGKVTVAVTASRDKVVDMIPVNWGVWRGHTAKNSGLKTDDMCDSSYIITLYLIGPAGVAPF